jgi:hypothetical protein
MKERTHTTTEVFWVKDVQIHTDVNEDTGQEYMHIEINPNSIGTGEISFTLYAKDSSFGFYFDKKVKQS